MKKRQKCKDALHMKKISIDPQHLIDLIHWARRYCDSRRTYAPTQFNKIYQAIRSEYPDFIRCHDQFDGTLKGRGKYWPYAQDGQFNEKTGSYEARPMNSEHLPSKSEQMKSEHLSKIGCFSEKEEIEKKSLEARLKLNP